MEKIGKSSIWVERYRPQTIKDILLPEKHMRFFGEILAKGEVPNMLFFSSAGTGKTSVAKALGNDLGADILYINAAKDLNMEAVRHDVTQFASSHGFFDGKKIVILDELERVKTTDTQEALKVLMEECEANARFIVCTNNIHKMIDPLQSRLMPIPFRYSSAESQKMMLAAFKRVQFILDNEGIQYDKKVLAEFVKKLYPDLRKVINQLQMYVLFNGAIDEKIISFVNSGETFNELFQAMRTKKFEVVRKICASIDPSEFYTYFYKHAVDKLDNGSKIKAIMILKEAARDHSMSTDAEINLVCCVVELMNELEWK